MLALTLMLINQGVVTLKGNVDSEAERDLAIKIAENTEDVREVNDELRVMAE